jgi:hypothetical protein
MNTLPSPAERLAGPERATAEEVAAHVVAAAVWAPSVHNTQPWWFRTHGQEISLYADASRQLRVADPGGREMMISCGAALFTARLALRCLGYIPGTRVLPDPAQPWLVARVSWQRRADPTEYEQRLFRWVRQRRTHRGGFAPLPLAPELLTALQAGAERDGALLRIITGEGSRAALAAVAETAAHAMRLDSAYVQELARWVSPPGSTRADGVPATAYPARPDRTDPHFPGRDFAHGHRWGLPSFSFGAASRSAGVVCLLTTAGDRPRDWVNAGQALQRVLLATAACGVAAALHSQPLELPWLRDYIRTHWSDGTYPQLLLRLGTVAQAAVSVRRPPGAVMLPCGGEPPGADHD